jgi:hypothetical protein
MLKRDATEADLDAQLRIAREQVRIAQKIGSGLSESLRKDADAQVCCVCVVCCVLCIVCCSRVGIRVGTVCCVFFMHISVLCGWVYVWVGAVYVNSKGEMVRSFHHTITTASLLCSKASTTSRPFLRSLCPV